jgi:hypothetical protein
MNPSLQLVFNKIYRTLDEMHRKFDESNAHWDRRFAELVAMQEQQDAAEDLRVGVPKQIEVMVVSDN